MHLKQSDIIDAPQDKIFQLVRDELPKLVPFLPNVERIEMVSRREEGNLTYITNHWFAKVEIPAIAEKFIKKEIFSWKDVAVWNNEQSCVEYTLESFWANDLYTAKGINSFKALDDKRTELIVACDITLHADKVPGVPKFLVSRVLPAIETLVEKILGPNLEQLGKGLKSYFSQQK